ncbi:phage virion morphogenesis protein [Bordetella sp. 2513F-2]
MSAGTFEDVAEWAAGLMARLSPAERRRVNRLVAVELRRAQSDRIAAQRNPDGSTYAPRRARKNLRGKTGHIRRKMFTRLRTARYLKAQATESTALVGFTGATARIARIHQYGLRDRPSPGMPDVRYAVRALLGFTGADRARILDAYARHLAGLGL